MWLIPWRKQGKSSASFQKSEVETKGSLAAPDRWLLELFNGGAPSSAGPFVSPLTAMTCAPWRCGVQAIAETIGQLPVQVFERGENNARDQAKDHPLYPLLHDAVNDWTSASTFREQTHLATHCFGRMAAFAFINRVNGKPVELIRFDPRWTPVIPRCDRNGEPLYEVMEKGETRLLSWRDVIHIPSPSELLSSGCGA